MSRTLDYTKQGFSMSEGGWGTRRRNLVIKAILSLHKENIGKLLDLRYSELNYSKRNKV